jgi:hypothetical protein
VHEILFTCEKVKYGEGANISGDISQFLREQVLLLLKEFFPNLYHGYNA